MTAEVEKASSAGVPDLVRTPALEISAEDVALPRLYVGQYMSPAVQAKLVDAGDIFTALGQDDGDPNLVALQGESVVVHILGLWKGKSSQVDGELERYAFNDPDAPEDAWVTYNYTIALPEIDPEIPYKWLLTRTGTSAAKQINLVLSKNQSSGPPWATAFEISTAHRKNSKGQFYIAQVKPVEAKPENVEAAEALAVIVSGSQADVQAKVEQPAI